MWKRRKEQPGRSRRVLKLGVLGGAVAGVALAGWRLVPKLLAGRRRRGDEAARQATDELWPRVQLAAGDQAKVDATSPAGDGTGEE